jgi:hypothetical protein
MVGGVGIDPLLLAPRTLAPIALDPDRLTSQQSRQSPTSNRPLSDRFEFGLDAGCTRGTHSGTACLSAYRQGSARPSGALSETGGANPQAVQQRRSEPVLTWGNEKR